MIIISLFLVILVASSCVAVIFLFFKRLNLIQEELWGQKKKEAEATAAAERKAQEEADTETESATP